MHLIGQPLVSAPSCISANSRRSVISGIIAIFKSSLCSREQLHQHNPFLLSESEAVATQAEESGEAIARCFNSGEELIRGMGEDVLMTLAGMVRPIRNNSYAD